MNMEYEKSEEKDQADMTVVKPFDLERGESWVEEDILGQIQIQRTIEKPQFKYAYAYDSQPGPQHTDVVYFFPEGSKTGVKVYLQCPKEALAGEELVVSGMEVVEYDENVHGVKDQWHSRKVKNGESVDELTREVSEEDYAKILLQGVIQTHPEISGQLHIQYFIIDLQETNTKALSRLSQIIDTPAQDLPNTKVCAHLLDDHLGTLVRMVSNNDKNKLSTIAQQYSNLEDKKNYGMQEDLRLQMYSDNFEKDEKVTNNIEESKGPKR